MHERDRLARQLGVRVELRDRRIVPGLDLAEIDLGERRAVDRQFARLDAVEIHDRHDAAHHRRELREADLSSSLPGSGASDAPNVTVLALICLMPPPEPID